MMERSSHFLYINSYESLLTMMVLMKVGGGGVDVDVAGRGEGDRCDSGEKCFGGLSVAIVVAVFAVVA